MEPRRVLRIAHLSDLHLGKEGESAWRQRRVLGEAWQRNLEAIAQDGPIDLMCFTGDLAQSGQPAQYEQARAFIDETLALLRVPKERFFCVPGNHDVDRAVAKLAWREVREGAWEVQPAAFARWIAGGRAPRGFDDAWREAVLSRQAAYRDWLAGTGLQALLPGAHGPLGYRVSLDLGLGAPLHVIGLDSAWLAGDDHDASNLRLTDEQVARLLTEQGKPLPGWKIALVHHPLGELADGREAQRLLAEYGVSLLLHGHLHDAEVARWATPAASLHISAAGCLYEHDRYPNALQVLDVAVAPGQLVEPQRLWVRAWSGRGHWHDDDSLYPGSVAGRLVLAPEPEPMAAFTPGQFIGREEELQQLCAALLPQPGQALRPTVLCCAIEGMAGVGKTRLAEHFVQAHWLPALGLPAGDGPAGHHLRLILDPLEPTPTAFGLGQQLADRLHSSGPHETLWLRLGAALKQGPHGHPLLLLIENVDAEPQARAVGELVNRLPGCPILVTARYQRLGGAGWSRVPVAQMPPVDARALLRAELEPGAHPLTDAEAGELARQLGGLPLALHIAASHLNLGLTPQAFLAELRRAGLGLEPAEPGDPRLTADRARAILRSSFELSWRHWCAGRGADPAWQQALVALAHGPAAPTGLSLSAAITTLEEEVYPVFATAAARLSLLQYSAQEQRTALHPLIAEFLRSRPAPDAATVLQRLGGWFMRRLPETDNEAQGQAWAECWAEVEALTHWLGVVPLEAGLTAERAGRVFAVRNGPYAAWQSFCERLIGLTGEPTHHSNLWWTLSRTAFHAGDLTQALRAAEARWELERQRGDERAVAAAVSLIADVLQLRGEWNEALRIRRDELLPVYEKLGDVHSRAVTMSHIASALQLRGEWAEALHIWRKEVLPVFEILGDVRGRAATMGHIADVLQSRGEWEEALHIWREEVLPVYEKLGDMRERAMTMDDIANVLQSRGEWDEALRIWREEVLPILERLGDVRERAVKMGRFANTLQLRGEWSEALRIWREEVLPVYEKLGDVRARAVTLGYIANVLQARGELQEALRIRREEQLPIFEKLGDARERAVTMGRIADVLVERGELDEALRIRREEVLPVYEKLGDLHSRAVAMGRLAQLLAMRGEWDEALRIRREEQLPVYEELGDIRSRAVTMGHIADVLQSRGDLNEALRIWREEVLPVFEKLGDVREQAATMGKIADLLQLRGKLDEAMLIWRDEVLPVLEKLGDVRARLLTLGHIAEALQASGDLGEALRIRREEILPILEKLGDARLLSIGRANLATCLFMHDKQEWHAEIKWLLAQALSDAVRMKQPHAAQIRQLHEQMFGVPLALDI